MLAVAVDGGLAAQPALQDAQRLADRHVQRLGLGGRPQALGGAHEQLLAELLAQARQGVAHRRLAAVQAQGGARQVLFLHQGVEHQQQVQIELLQIPDHE